MNRKVLINIERLNYVLGGVLSAVAALVLPTDQSLGVLAGVVISSINFSILRRVVENWLQGAKEGSNISGLLLVPKMAAVMVAVVLALNFLPISAHWFMVGFSIFALSIAIETARALTNPPSGTNRSNDNGEANG